jgi:hypothetical protein
MSHPFFDVSTYPWHRPDADAAHRALYGAIQDPGKIDHIYRRTADCLEPLRLDIEPAGLWREVLDRLARASLLRRLCELILADAGIAAIHPMIHAVVEAASPRGLGRTPGTDDGVTGSATLTVARIEVFDKNKDIIRQALRLYEKRIPAEERYPFEHMVDLVRRHMSDEFGPDWRLHFITAQDAGRVVGFLVAYEDLANQYTFIAYLVADRPRRGEHNAAVVSEALVTRLIEDYRDKGRGSRQTRFLFEIDHPALTVDPRERRRRLARFEWFYALAPFEKLHLRGLGVRYLQPKLEWPSDAPERDLLLCYSAPGLQAALARPEVIDILKWTYTELYADDIFEDPEQRAGYGGYIRQLLAEATAALPDKVLLLNGNNLRSA